MTRNVVGGLVPDEVQGVLIPQNGQTGGKILVGGPELEEHRQKREGVQPEGHVPPALPPPPQGGAGPRQLGGPPVEAPGRRLEHPVPHPGGLDDALELVDGAERAGQTAALLGAAQGVADGESLVEIRLVGGAEAVVAPRHHAGPPVHPVVPAYKGEVQIRRVVVQAKPADHGLLVVAQKELPGAVPGDVIVGARHGVSSLLRRGGGGRLGPHAAIDGQALFIELGLIVGHDPLGAVLVEIPGDLAQGVARRRELQQGELKEGLVVGLELHLPSVPEDLPVGLQEAPMGQAALGLALGRPGVAEVDVDAVRLAGGEVVRQQGGVSHHEKYVLQVQGHGPLHGHHQSVRDLLDGDEEHVRVFPGGLHGEPALAAAQLQTKLPGLGHQRLTPAPPQGEAVGHMDGGAALHPGDQVFLFPHPHDRIPPETFSDDHTTIREKRQERSRRRPRPRAKAAPPQKKLYAGGKLW